MITNRFKYNIKVYRGNLNAEYTLAQCVSWKSDFRNCQIASRLGRRSRHRAFYYDCLDYTLNNLSVHNQLARYIFRSHWFPDILHDNLARFLIAHSSFFLLQNFRSIFVRSFIIQLNERERARLSAKKKVLLYNFSFL